MLSPRLQAMLGVTSACYTSTLRSIHCYSIGRSPGTGQLRCGRGARPGRYFFEGAPLSLMRARTRAGAAALSRALRRLEARDLVMVSRSESGRATHICLTSDGHRATAKC
jgi:hypothetical protein